MAFRIDASGSEEHANEFDFHDVTSTLFDQIIQDTNRNCEVVCPINLRCKSLRIHLLQLGCVVTDEPPTVKFPTELAAINLPICNNGAIDAESVAIKAI